MAFLCKNEGNNSTLRMYKFQSLYIHSTECKQSDSSFVVNKAWLTLVLLTWRVGWAPNKASKWQMGFNSVFKGLNVWKTKRKLTSFKVLSKYLFGRTKENQENLNVTCHRTEIRTPYPHFVHVFSYLDRSQRPVQSSVGIRDDDSSQAVTTNMPDGFKSEN